MFYFCLKTECELFQVQKELERVQEEERRLREQVSLQKKKEEEKKKQVCWRKTRIAFHLQRY